MARPYALGFIGAGNMAEGIVAGVLAAGACEPDAVIVADPTPERRRLFEERFGATAVEDGRKVAASADTVVLAITPQIFADVASDLTASLRSDQLIVSIMAGWSTLAIADALGGGGVRVVRVMPNLPIRVGAGVAGIVGGAHATGADVALVEQMFEAAGQSVILDDEGLMDAVTAVSGSGPAYYYLFTEAIVSGGIAAGLNEDQALRLAENTCLGAARTMLETGLDPAELRRLVTKKGGTTQAAIESMTAAGVPEAIKQAVLAAARRSKELGK
ncbi:MAG: pyrroline-5-carboxylate reductase [Phycisphaerae bacterium]|nr:pyrroline-5-carboxylate reductase [Phycisphaerae bacterium]